MVMIVVRLFCRPFERRLQWVIPSLAQSEKRPEIKEGTKARFSKATKMNGQGQGDGKYGKAKLARITTCMDVVSIGTSRDSRNLP